MKIIVTSDYDYLRLKNLLELCLLSNSPGATIYEFIEDGNKHFKILNLDLCIECCVIPEYKTVYKKIKYSRDRDLIEEIDSLIRKWKCE